MDDYDSYYSSSGVSDGADSGLFVGTVGGGAPGASRQGLDVARGNTPEVLEIAKWIRQGNRHKLRRLWTRLGYPKDERYNIVRPSWVQLPVVVPHHATKTAILFVLGPCEGCGGGKKGGGAAACSVNRLCLRSPQRHHVGRNSAKTVCSTSLTAGHCYTWLS